MRFSIFPLPNPLCDNGSARNMIFAMAVYLVHRTYPGVFKAYLTGFNTLWGQLLSVTTFTLTFFVNQSYALWRKCMELSRRLQGMFLPCQPLFRMWTNSLPVGV